MSIQAVAWVLAHSESRLGTRLVAIAVGSHADRDGLNAWAGVEKYAADAHLSERQVRRGLQELLAMGELHRCGKKGTPKGTYRYCFPLMEAGGCPEASGHPDRLSNRTNRQGNRTFSTSNRTPVSPEPSAEPSAEPSLDTAARSATRPRNLIWDALVSVYGPAPISRRFRGKWQVAAKELREQGAEPRQVVVIARTTRARRDIAWMAATPAALASNWGQLLRGVPHARASPSHPVDVAMAAGLADDGEEEHGEAGGPEMGRAPLRRLSG